MKNQSSSVRPGGNARPMFSHPRTILNDPESAVAFAATVFSIAATAMFVVLMVVTARA